jgi:hypothetical protein
VSETTDDVPWITSPAALAGRIMELGRRHELAEALLRRAVPVLEERFRAQPRRWRVNFQHPTWNKRRRGDGRLGGDWLDGGWGPLSGEIEWLMWTVGLAWAREISDAEIIGSFLGLHVPPRGLSLQRLPSKAQLELWPVVVEPALLQWAAQSEPPRVTIEHGGTIGLQHSGSIELRQPPRAPTNADDPAPPPRSPPDAAELKRRKDSQAKFTPEQREAAIAEFKRTYVGLPGRDRRWEAWKRDFYETGRGPWLGREDFG